MGTVEKFFAGLTVVAVAGTIFTSKYSSSIIGTTFGGISKVYSSAKG